jgi:hypothetical protein
MYRIHYFLCGIHLFSLRTCQNIMNPRHGKMNPYQKCKVIGSGFIYLYVNTNESGWPKNESARKKIVWHPRPKLMNTRIIMTLFVPYSFFLVWDSFVFTADTFQNRNQKGERHESAAEWNVSETRKNESGRTYETDFYDPDSDILCRIHFMKRRIHVFYVGLDEFCTERNESAAMENESETQNDESGTNNGVFRNLIIYCGAGFISHCCGHVSKNKLLLVVFMKWIRDKKKWILTQIRDIYVADSYLYVRIHYMTMRIH